ncbi:MAG: amidohydrolase family protein [Bacteroidota bacterium]
MRKIQQFIGTMALLLFCQSLLAQITFPRNGVYDEQEGYYAFTGATIFKSYNEKIENGTMVIKDGKVQMVGTRIPIPAGAVVVDLKGKYIYPSFIDMYSTYGIPEAKRASGGGWNRPQQMVSKKEGAYSWNQALKPEYKSHEHFSVDDKAAKSYRDIGFGTVMTHREDGISRGTATVVMLGEENEHHMMLKEASAHMMSFKKGTSTQNYPGSLMGGIALLRQTYLDGQWYQNGGKEKEMNLSLEAWNDIQSLPVVFDVRDKLEILRAAKLGKEFRKNYIIKGNGDEYQRLKEIKATGSPLIIPINFPDAYDVEDPYDAMLVSLAQMKHWELAPTNLAHLSDQGIEFALTTSGLKKKSDFLKNLKKAIQHGLSKENALKALTHTPAKMMGVSDQVGILQAGSMANFIITSEDIFNEKAKIHHNWVKGKPFVIKRLDEPDLEGKYVLKVGRDNYNLVVDEKNKMKIEVNDSTKINVSSKIDNHLITITFSPTKKETKLFRLSGAMNGKEWMGNGTNLDGTWTTWSTTYQGENDPKEKNKKGKKGKDQKDKKEKANEKIGDIIYPFIAHGYKKRPTENTYLIKNATVWTNENQGILKNTDVLVRNGKIVEIGKNIQKDLGTRINGTGMHLTCGVIDEHSHIAITRGVNECTQVSTAEVRIGDVIDSEDIDIYRQLAGGVTTSQLLHGSCNPIGGQSAIIKLRWGYAPEEMKFEGAPGFIKFALGENVKKSRSSRNNRFPDTRMGVEQVYRDYFTRAKAYKIAVQKNEKGFRRDLDLEAVAEILDKKRHISCHSYVQSEINMLMHVGEEMGFKVNTFTHILEGYKVADKMAKHGAGGSSFSDWWAYKYEVIDAIPYNGAIMHSQGVLTAFNSDDAEMARRLNQEAGKAVKYGGVSEEDAWKFVTLNPAKLLHIDHKVGSIKVGKDADLVLWNDHPMSVYAKAEMTFVDGVKLFDRKEDIKLRAEIAAERNRLIQKMIAVKKGGGKTRPASGTKSMNYHCDNDEDEMD